MKKFLLISGIAIGGLLSAASAQDCCPVQYDTCCGAGFDGFYIGGNVGALTHVAHRNDLDGFFTDNSGWTTTSTDVTAGIQLGYDWQCCNAVFGLVADWNWANNNHRFRDDPNGDNDGFSRSEFNWFTTIRARAGLSVCDALVYVTGGAAVAHFENRWSDLVFGDFRHDHTRWGWTGGVGAEFILGCNWSIGLEFLYLHFDTTTRTFTNDVGASFDFAHSDSSYVGRFIVNYRFGDLFCCW